ncbi:MAG: lipoprotein, partial [Longicatena sp.]
MKKILVSLFAVALLAGCGSTKNDDKVIRIGASTTPHAEIIKHVQPVLEKAGYEVIIKEFT